MFDINFSPAWFYGKEMLIDLFSIIVLSLIATFSMKYYKLDKKNKNYFWFAISFILLSVSFLFKILVNFLIYYDLIDIPNFEFFSSTSNIVLTEVLFSIAFFIYMLIALVGLFILYEIYQKNHSKQQFLLMLFFILIITYFATSGYFVFHLTSLLFLSFISINYFKNYLKKKNKYSQILFFSFLIITFSQLIFIFVALYNSLYVLAEITQLIGYLLLLITFIGVIKYAKKK